MSDPDRNQVVFAQAMDEALASYERRRNEATLPDYRLNLDRARFTPAPEHQRQMRAALHGDADATRRFLLAVERLAPREALVSPGQAELTTN